MKRVRQILLAIILVIAGVVTPLTASADSETQISGAVTDQAGNTMPNVHVAFFYPGSEQQVQSGVMTGWLGKYTTAIAPGTYDLRFKPYDGSIGAETVRISDFTVGSEAIVHDQIVNRTLHHFTGVAKDQYGTPFAGKKVNINHNYNLYNKEILTSETGAYDFYAPEGMYHVNLTTHDGGQTRSTFQATFLANSINLNTDIVMDLVVNMGKLKVHTIKADGSVAPYVSVNHRGYGQLFFGEHEARVFTSGDGYTDQNGYVEISIPEGAIYDLANTYGFVNRIYARDSNNTDFTYPNPIMIGSGNNEITIRLSNDSTPPTVTGTLSAQPNSAGWNNADFIINWNAVDDSGTATQPALSSITTEGKDAVIESGESCDQNANCSKGMLTYSLDKTIPTATPLTWTVNPKPVTSSSQFSFTASDPAVSGVQQSGVKSAEYFVGEADPGQGSGIAMTLSNPQTMADGTVTSATATGSVGTNLASGVYKVSYRVQDVAGNWSALSSEYLTVFDATGPKDLAVAKKFTPKASTDALPGLLSDNQTGEANIGLDILNDSSGVVSTGSTLNFDYTSDKKCKKPNTPNCYTTTFTVNTSQPNTISWLAFTGQNSSQASSQGTGTLKINNTTSVNPFKVFGMDGVRTTPQSNDGYSLMIYAPNANMSVDSPIYKAAFSGSGNWVKIQ